MMSKELRESKVAWQKLRRLVVASALVAAGASGAYVVSTGAVFFGADGIVTRQRIAVAAPWHDARIREVYVRPGDNVDAGQKIAVVESTSILRSLADLASDKARISGRLAELGAREHVVSMLLPLAEASAKQAQTFLATVQKAGADGLAVNKSLHEMLTASLQAADRLLSMQAEQNSLAVEIETNKKALEQISSAYDNLQHSYDNGNLYAPVGGHIGSTVALVGEVLSPGKDEIANIYTGNSYVLAYIPDSYWLKVQDGRKVAVKVRGRTVAGHIESVLPVTDALPPEFQLPTKPRGRGQLVRVALNSDNDIAVGQKAVVTNCYFRNCRFSLSGMIAAALSDRGQGGKPPVKTPSQNVVGTAAEERHRS